MPTNDSSQSELMPAVRLIFEYEGDQVRLISQQSVEMAITGFDISSAEQSGYYVDTRDSQDATLARIPVRNAFSASLEVFPENRNEQITRIDVEMPKRGIHRRCSNSNQCRSCKSHVDYKR